MIPATERTSVSPQRIRLEFLDGMRGLAALYVVFHHAAFEIPDSQLSKPYQILRHVFDYGHYAVAVFIVLSGYCLMLPIARDPEGKLRGGFFSYMKRRAVRVLPPYYAALALFLALIALIPAMRQPDGSRWDAALPALTPTVVLSHIFMVHNLNADWIYRIDPPMWSVATEWQIYLLFPLLLVAWRRAGVIAAVAVAILVGDLPEIVTRVTRAELFFNASFWYAGLFAFGLAAALVNFSQDRRLQACERRTPWLALSGILLIFAILLLARYPHRMRDIDRCIGAATACLIVHGARGVKEEKHLWILRVLESPGLLALGSFSYSLYLVHFPILSMGNLLMRNWQWGASTRFISLILLGPALCIAAAFLFHLTFERRFTVRSESPRTRRIVPSLSGLKPTNASA